MSLFLDHSSGVYTSVVDTQRSFTQHWNIEQSFNKEKTTTIQIRGVCVDMKSDEHSEQCDFNSSFLTLLNDRNLHKFQKFCFYLQKKKKTHRATKELENQTTMYRV